MSSVALVCALRPSLLIFVSKRDSLQPGNNQSLSKNFFLSHNLFSQAYRVCDWFFNVDCPKAEEQYENNNELYKDADGNPI